MDAVSGVYLGSKFVLLARYESMHMLHNVLNLNYALRSLHACINKLNASLVLPLNVTT